MPINDIRELIQVLENANELKRIKAEVDADLEIAEMKRLEQFLGMDNLRASFAFSKVIAFQSSGYCIF